MCETGQGKAAETCLFETRLEAAKEGEPVSGAIRAQLRALVGNQQG